MFCWCNNNRLNNFHVILKMIVGLFYMTCLICNNGSSRNIINFTMHSAYSGMIRSDLFQLYRVCVCICVCLRVCLGEWWIGAETSDNPLSHAQFSSSPDILVSAKPMKTGKYYFLSDLDHDDDETDYVTTSAYTHAVAAWQQPCTYLRFLYMLEWIGRPWLSVPVSSVYTHVPPIPRLCSNALTEKVEGRLAKCLTAHNPPAPAPITATRMDILLPQPRFSFWAEVEGLAMPNVSVQPVSGPCLSNKTCASIVEIYDGSHARCAQPVRVRVHQGQCTMRSGYLITEICRSQQNSNGWPAPSHSPIVNIPTFVIIHRTW